MALLTILVQSSRIDFFDAALASVVNQSFSDIDIVVGDNTSDAIIIEMFESKFRDPRIRWLHAYPYTNGSQQKHAEFLLGYADSKYVRYMFDDDILFPTSSSTLLALIINSGSKFAFHNRKFLIGTNLLPGSSLFHGEHPFIIDSASAAKLIFCNSVNIFCEPPFSIFDTEALRLAMRTSIRGITPKFLGDVHNALEIGRHSTIAVFPGELGAFRIHEQQESAEMSPIRLLGYVEWELMARNLNERHNFAKHDFVQSKERLLNLYRSNSRLSEKLEPFISNLIETHSPESFVVTDSFMDLLRDTGLY